MGINLLRGSRLVEGNEAVEQVVACCIVIVTTIVVREIVTEGRVYQFLLEQVDLVQEEDDRGLDEPTGVANRVK